jgi:uncharacterized protein YfiM (DUF2279 family)
MRRQTRPPGARRRSLPRSVRPEASAPQLPGGDTAPGPPLTSDRQRQQGTVRPDRPSSRLCFAAASARSLSTRGAGNLAAISHLAERQQLAADVLDELAILVFAITATHSGSATKAPQRFSRSAMLSEASMEVILLAATADQRGPKPSLTDAVLLADPQRLVLAPRQQRRLAPRHAAVDPQFVDHGPSARAVWTDISRSLSARIGAASDQRRFDSDVPVRCSRIGTHLVGRLDKALRSRALHPRKAHVEASGLAEGAPVVIRKQKPANALPPMMP